MSQPTYYVFTLGLLNEYCCQGVCVLCVPTIAYLSGPMFLSPHTGYISSSFAVQVVAFPPKSCLVVNWTQLVAGKL